MNKRERERKQVHEKYGECCSYCGEPITLKQMQVDHLKPVYRGNESVNPQFRGTDTVDNMMPACAPCNRWKATMSVDQFRSEIEAQVDRLRRDSAAFRMAERHSQVEPTGDPVVFWFEAFE